MKKIFNRIGQISPMLTKIIIASIVILIVIMIIIMSSKLMNNVKVPGVI